MARGLQSTGSAVVAHRLNCSAACGIFPDLCPLHWQADSQPLHHQGRPRTSLKWIKDLNIRPETIKLLEENVGGKLLDIDLGNDFLDLTPKEKATKAKINKWDYFKKLLHNKGNHQQNEKATYRMGGKIFANHISDKGLIYKIHKVLIQLNSKKKLIKKWAEELDIFPKKTHRDFPGGPVVKTLCFQCRGPGFDPWSGNWILHAATKNPACHTNGQQVHEKMLNITNHQRNTNQNYKEISLHTCQNTCPKKARDNKYCFSPMLVIS